MSTQNEKINKKVKGLFDHILEASKIYKSEIAPTLGMFTDINSSLALKCIKEPKEEWEYVFQKSASEYMNDTSKPVNGVILIHEARVALPKIDDMSRVMHYLNTLGTLENCPFAKMHDVVVCTYTLRDLTTNMFIVKADTDEDGTRHFEEFKIEANMDTLSGRMVEMCQSLFYSNSKVISD